MTQTTESPTFTFDEEKFRAATPYILEPTHLPGVFTTPAPARSFDPNKASAGDLVRAGLLWKRPDAASPPAFRTAWDRVMSRTWRPEDRIVPQFAVQTGKTHHLRAPPVKRAEGTYSSTVWAGAGTRGGKWTTVIGYWFIPTVSKPSEAQGTEGGWNSSSWIGIDGFIDSNDVLQAGVEQRVNAQGQAAYVAWYEWFAPPQPNSPGYIWQTNITNFPVSPGQEVYCSVQYTNNNTAGYISFGNSDTGQHFSITLAPPPGASFSGQSIEWIMEAPDGGEPVSSLPRFSPVVFTSALACGANNTSANPASGDTLYITNAAGTVTLTSTIVGTDEAAITFTG
ncbi:MAG TPA: G1 family glutamic endopeptidase [Methylocella sp.]|nr:G1 family glutamic endopeptidase [Methylocella sp.]